MIVSIIGLFDSFEMVVDLLVVRDKFKFYFCFIEISDYLTYIKNNNIVLY